MKIYDKKLRVFRIAPPPPGDLSISTPSQARPMMHVFIIMIDAILMGPSRCSIHRPTAAIDKHF